MALRNAERANDAIAAPSAVTAPVKNVLPAESCCITILKKNSNGRIKHRHRQGTKPV
ncbi:hypothetical protein KOY49_02345 [Candidatus Minimicrobia vallesae]|uniref:Uncharacterized protein n=1 Tax=Candidatus Minimicrobia vallesae TaxID=2841264 RepID=A0A8F1SAS5_9BACT|nr:hypothetical protein [Candidatus Minimicrobia vallesae]QWQ31804.1 hypothetical protein KOY49_02345 [Candidatus Minimicrobia vallesae]